MGHSGLIIFAVLSVYLSGKGKPVLQRAQRLLLPWAIWFAVYGAIEMWRKVPALNESHGVVAAILNGTAYHLWYMPFIFLVLVGLDAFKRVAAPATQAWLAAIAALLLLATLRLWQPASVAWNLPWSHYLAIAPALCFGLFLSRFDSLPKTTGRTLLALIWLNTLVVPEADIGLPYKIGFTLAIIALLYPPRLPARLDVAVWSRCTLGIYLLHPLLLMPMIAYRAELGIFMPIIAFVGSALIIRLALKVQWLARYAL